MRGGGKYAVETGARAGQVFAAMPALLSQDEIDSALKRIPEWEHEKKHIERTFDFDDFITGIDFVNGVADISEELEHHPDIDIRYGKVVVRLTTHSKGGLTDADFELAEKIDTLAE